MIESSVIVYAVVDDALSPDFARSVELEGFICREDAEYFVQKMQGDDLWEQLSGL